MFDLILWLYSNDSLYLLKPKKMKNTQPDEKEYSAMTIAGLTKEDLVVIAIALVVTTSLFISCLI